MGKLSCVWWNVENLYPHDPHFEPKSGSEWPNYRPETQAEYDEKLDGLADVLLAMPDGPPDLLMVCEVAVKSVVGNRDALRDLASRLGGNRGHYLCAKGDGRGITSGAIWNADVLEKQGRAGVYVVTSILGTERGRPILKLRMRDRESGSEFTVYLNHWKSRRGDYHVARESRRLAGERLSALLQRRLCTKGNPSADPDVRILVVGDFNDEPYNESLTDISRERTHLYATRDKRQVIQRVPTRLVPLLYNPSWRLLGQMLTCSQNLPLDWLPAGTYRFDAPSPDHWSTFDQVLVSGGMLTGAPPAFQDDSLEVYWTCEMLDSTGKPDWPSDHLPIRFVLQF